MVADHPFVNDGGYDLDTRHVFDGASGNKTRLKVPAVWALDRKSVCFVSFFKF